MLPLLLRPATPRRILTTCSYLLPKSRCSCCSSPPSSPCTGHTSRIPCDTHGYGSGHAPSAACNDGAGGAWEHVGELVVGSSLAFLQRTDELLEVGGSSIDRSLGL